MTFHGVRQRSIALAAAAATAVLAGRARGQLASFPGAQGFGGDATGGRGGSIYVVTNLNDSGAGSFRDAVSHSNRIVVFAVGGYVNLQSAVSCASNLTILGQTAPGQGIGLMGRELSFDAASNDVVQYLRAREGSIDPAEKASINLGSTTGVILDHCSVEYAQYDNIDAVGTNGVANLTIQNCLLADPIKAQQFNMHTEGTQVTYLNNLWANAHNRNPLAKSNTQFVNNVVYDYQGGYTTGNSAGTFSYDVVNNYFIAGPSTSSPSNAFYQLDSNQSAFLSGNLLDANKDGTLNGSAVTTADGAVILPAAYSAQTQFLPTLTAAGAYAFTLAHAGDLYNNGTGTFARDEVDAQVASQVASVGTAGSIYNTEVSTGNSNAGFGTLAVANNSSGSLDTVPLAWLTAHGLSTTNAAGLLKLNPLGYRFIEQYAQEAQDQYASQTATAGSWTTTAAWSSAAPGLYDHALIRGTGTANGSVAVSTGAATAFSVSVGGNGPAAGESLAVSGGSLVVQDTIYLGDRNNATLALSGGTVRAANLQLGNTAYDANGVPTSYTGTFNFTGGTLQVGQVVLGAGTPGSYTGGAAWTWSGGTLQAFGTLTVNAPATLAGAGATVNTVGPDGVTNSAVMTGVLSGAGGLTKAGAGTLTLGVANTYAGPTNISSGAILAAVTNSVAPASRITITGSGGQIQLADGVTISSPVVVSGSTASEFADAPGAANATLAGPVSLSGSAQFRLGDSGTGTLTFTGAATEASAYSFVTKGNIAFAAGSTLTDTATTGGLVVGRSATQAVSLSVTGAGSAVNLTRIPAGVTALSLGSGSASYASPSVTVTIGGGGAINVGPATVNLDADPSTATGTIATLNLNAGGTLTAGAFADAEAGVNAALLNLNGGTLVAGASDPTGGSFLPAFAGLTVAVGAGGATVNDAGHTVTIAEPLLTGVTTGADGGLAKLGTGTVTLAAANTYTGPTNVAGGSVVLAVPGALPAHAQLTLAAGTTVAAVAHGGGPVIVLDVNALALAGSSGAWAAKVDLSDDAAIVHGGSLATVTSQAAQGFAGGSWNGTAGLTSSAAAADASRLTAVGVIPNLAANGTSALYASFDGHAAAAGDVLVRDTYYGDANLDGSVTAADYTRVDAGFALHLSGWANGDFNYDGVVDGSDYTLMDNAFNRQAGTLGSPAAVALADVAPAAAVPEPASLGSACLLCLLARRSRRRRR